MLKWILLLSTARAAAANPPENDVCEKATLLLPDVPLTGSLKEATHDGQVPSCPFPGEGQYLSDCPEGLDGCRGVWFQVQGTGNIVSVATLGATEFSAQLAVYTGASICSGLQCIEWNSCDRRMAGTEGGNCGEAYWKSALGVHYLVFLRPDSLDSFQWRETDMQYEIMLTEFSAPFNEYCASATELAVPGENKGSLGGSTMDDAVHACVEKPADLTHGVWFLINGTGMPLEVSVCSEPYFTDTMAHACDPWVEYETTFLDCRDVLLTGCTSMITFDSDPPRFGCTRGGPAVAVLEGSSCDEPICIQSNQCKVLWESKLDQRYLVFVYGSRAQNYVITASEVNSTTEQLPPKSPTTIQPTGQTPELGNPETSASASSIVRSTFIIIWSWVAIVEFV